jgi:hypothetical protein
MLGTVVIIAVFSVWFVLSVLNQFGRGALIRPIKRRDSFSLIPVWTFFAPRPGVTDYNLLYRDRGRDGRCGPWHEIQPVELGWCKGLWNPGKRVRKGITDMCNMLMRQATPKIGKRLYLQIPYLTLLHHACEQPRNELSLLRQFAIVRTFGFGSSQEPQVVFVSALHRLEPGAPAELEQELGAVA